MKKQMTPVRKNRNAQAQRFNIYDWFFGSGWH